MRPALSEKFIDKAEAALTAAVEIYNKPTFLYREETFALLMLNAWELLLSAHSKITSHFSLSWFDGVIPLWQHLVWSDVESFHLGI